MIILLSSFPTRLLDGEEPRANTSCGTRGEYRGIDVFTHESFFDEDRNEH